MAAITRFPQAPAAVAAERTEVSVTPRGATTGALCAPGAPPARAAMPRTPGGAGRYGHRATAPAAAASSGAESGRAAARRPAPPAPARTAGPEGHRITGEDA
ncbi:hypothetical protein [Streptomyces venezuelae]|uniref:hypothetical protein n=1 Tax=Streptomyces venezuelae TaxID=54571 RepID=UPI003322FC46